MLLVLVIGSVLLGYTDMKEEFKDDINLVFSACN